MSFGFYRSILTASLYEGAALRRRVIEECSQDVLAAAGVLVESLHKGNKVLFFGNGGSAADAQHLAAELVCRFRDERQPLPGIALAADGSALTAIGNDYGFDQVFARQVKAIARADD